MLAEKILRVQRDSVRVPTAVVRVQLEALPLKVFWQACEEILYAYGMELNAFRMDLYA